MEVPKISEEYIASVTRNFPDVFLEFDEANERWQFVQKLKVNITKKRTGLIIIPGQPAPVEVYDNFWIVRICETPDGHYRKPNELDLEYIASISHHHHDPDKMLREFDEEGERREAKAEQENDEFHEEVAKEMKVAYNIDKNVPTIRPGITLERSKEKDVSQS